MSGPYGQAFLDAPSDGAHFLLSIISYLFICYLKNYQ